MSELVQLLRQGDLNRAARDLNKVAGERGSFEAFYTLGQTGLVFHFPRSKRPHLRVFTDPDRPVRIDIRNHRRLLPTDIKADRHEILAAALIALAQAHAPRAALPKAFWGEPYSVPKGIQ